VRLGTRADDPLHFAAAPFLQVIGASLAGYASQAVHACHMTGMHCEAMYTTKVACYLRRCTT
jgi:hypothetical protein